MKTCSDCNTALLTSNKPNKSGLCGICYRKMNYKRWKARQPNGRTEYNKQYNIANRSRLTKNKNDKYNSDIQFKLKETLRTRLSKAMTRNQKIGSAVGDLGCSILELKTYLESKFQLDMTWGNYGEWHIDHIKPLSLFDLTDKEQLKTACHYTNLQPLWAEDNISKGGRYDRH